MTTRYQYCWLKVTEVEMVDEDAVATQGPELTDFAIWPTRGSTGSVFITAPPRPAGAALQRVAGDVAVMGNCTPCPTAPRAKALAPAERFLPTDPPAPATVPDAAPSEGWQLESGSVAHNFDRPPRVLFACHPIEGDRQAALAWLASAAGVAWVKGSMSCTLLSYFHDDAAAP